MAVICYISPLDFRGLNLVHDLSCVALNPQESMKKILRLILVPFFCTALIIAGTSLYIVSTEAQEAAIASNKVGDGIDPQPTWLASHFKFTRYVECPKLLSTGEWQCDVGVLQVEPQVGAVLAVEWFVKWLAPWGEQSFAVALVIAGFLLRMFFDSYHGKATTAPESTTPTPPAS